ncbi:uncharacterized protein LOC129597962 [Paramacrobiotus metropolitanus]|uniref:uncharacterized protein LOC129597962 n=1 Tax=Paramacrobiotus metropolitanus TaxID=2943436 RepID=UPI0024459385|nr:uncharacterized protein LOC129597962 [Paramacrobiotus metropolitanus]
MFCQSADMEPCVTMQAKTCVNNGNRTICEDNIDDASDLDMVNWEQLEQELILSKKKKSDGSRLLNCLNLREEIRRQLAEDDAKKTPNGNMRKSKSGFLDETSSSESDNEELVEVPLTDGSSSTSVDDGDDDKEFYLNHEFSTKITIQKLSSNTGTAPRDADLDGAASTADNGHAAHHARHTPPQLVVRPLQSRPNLKTRIQNQKDLQICFLNELPGSVQRINSSSSGRSSSESGNPVVMPNNANHSNMSEGPTMFRQDFWSPPAEPSGRPVATTSVMPKSQSMFEMDTEKQKLDKLLSMRFEDLEFQWKQQMRNKIQHMHQNIRLQMQRQRKRRKRFPITTKVQFPHGKTRLDRQFLSDLNIAYLQVILNDLHCQIETLNEELVRYLEERDELHMEQDSKLVDIDDLSRRLQELWMVSSRCKDSAQGDCRQSSPNPSSAFFSRLKAQSASHNDNTDEINQHHSPEPAVTTPTSLNGSLQNFRQRIRSLLQ